MSDNRLKHCIVEKRQEVTIVGTQKYKSEFAIQIFKNVLYFLSRGGLYSYFQKVKDKTSNYFLESRIHFTI